MIRVAVYGFGRIGTMVAELCRDREDIDLAAGIVHDREKVGRDLGHLLGSQELGVTATSDVESVAHDPDIDALIYCGLGDSATVAATLATFADHGKTCLTVTGLIHPKTALGEQAARELDERVVIGGGRVVGVGWNPGFLLDLLPATMAHSVPGIRRVRAERVCELATWGPNLLSRLGLARPPMPGGPPDWETQIPLRESLNLISDSLAIGIGEPSTSFQPILATSGQKVRDFEIGSGMVKGFRAEFVGANQAGVEVALSWIGVHGLNLDHDLKLEDSATLKVEGSSTLEATIGGSILDDPFPATAARAVNALNPLSQMPAGLYRPDQLAASAYKSSSGQLAQEATWGIA